MGIFYFCLLDIESNNSCKILADFELPRGKDTTMINATLIDEVFRSIFH